MALQVWLPLTTDLHNQGLLNDVTVSNRYCTYESGGKIGGCYHAGVDQDLILNKRTSDLFSDNHSFTIAIWTKFISAPVANSGIFASMRYLSEATAGGFGLVNKFDKIQLMIAGTDFSEIDPVGSFITPEIGKWIHITATYDNSTSTYSLYLNGSLIKSNVYTAHTYIANNQEFVLGGCSQGGWNSKNDVCLNDIRLYDHCLSPKEVKEIAKGLVLHYPLNDAYLEETNNLFTYPTPGSSCTNSYKWDKTLHKDAISVSGWSSGYHGGVGNPSTVYHAHWIMMNGLPTMRFPYITNSLGQTPEWLGISGRFRLQPSNFISGIKYTVSFDAKADENNLAISCGLYYKRNSSENRNFYDGKRTTTLTTDWKRYSVTYTSQGAYEISSFYFYGVCSGPKGNRYIRNVQLEIKDHATPYTPNTRTATTVYDCSGYQNNGTISGALSCSTDSPRYKTCVQTSSSGKIQKDVILPSAITQYTISVWCKITDPNAAANLWTKHSNGVKGIIKGPDGGWIYSYNGGGLITRTSFLTTSGTITQTHPGFGQNYKDGNWHMYTIVGNGNINTCYLDGVMTGRSTLSNFVSYNINGQLNIGLTEECLVSDYRVYATALSEEDIKELYNTSAYVSDNGTLLTYNLEE